MSKIAVMDLYKQATDADLMMSRRDVHVQGLDSYVLRNDNGRLIRVFHARQNLLMANYPYSPSMTLGIHDHRYDLTLVGVQGKAISYQWLRGSTTPTPDSLWHYRWRTQLGGDPGWERVGLRNLHLDSARELETHRPFYLSHNMLHTVWAEPGSAWRIEEGITRKTETDMFTQDSEIDVLGLYHQFDDIRDVRESFQRAFD